MTIWNISSAADFSAKIFKIYLNFSADIYKLSARDRWARKLEHEGEVTYVCGLVIECLDFI